MKRLIIILIILIVIGIPVYLYVDNQQANDDFYETINEFSLLLKQHDYEQAKIIYDNASSSLKANYNISLDGYAHNLVEEAARLETTQESLDLLYEYNEIGYVSPEVNTAILYYEDLLQSNYTFAQGLEYYNNGEFDQAMSCFNDVLEYDENYSQAQNYLNTYQNYIMAWNEAVENDSYGRHPEVNSVAYKEGNMYMPYKFTDSFAIIKVNASSKTILSYPIVSNENGAKVSDLNIIGDYIFFLIQHNDSSQKEIMDNAVYRMSLDGSDLTKITDCDYTYMLSYRDKFYAISESKGIVEADKYFLEEKVLVESDEILEMQLTDEGIFYTIDEKDSDINIAYFFDGQDSEEIMQNVNMHYYDYGVNNVIYYDTTGYYEYLYLENMSTGNPNNSQIFAGDIYKYYGMLNDNVILTFIGDYQQECVSVINTLILRTTYRADNNEISYKPLGICYETGLVLLESDAGISFTTEDMRIQDTIALPHINSTVLLENEKQTAKEQNYFTEDPEVYFEENRWLYSDETVNISTVEQYLDIYESTVYITHIHTSDYKWLQVEAFADTTLPIDAMENAVWAMAGETVNTDSIIDENKGTLNTDAYVFNDDGMFIIYKEANIIPAEKVLANTVVHVFAQGDIIVDNYQVTQAAKVSKNSIDGRSAIGMIEPGHYVAVVAKSDSKTNRGITQYTLANILKDEGCISAYCFDKGYTPFNIFMGQYVYSGEYVEDKLATQNQILYYTAN